MVQPFERNVIALIWDFDKTLIDGYMQQPIFAKYGVNGNAFWEEVNALAAAYRRKYPRMRVNRETIYLNHFLTCVQQGVFPGLNNDVLHELGAQLTFYPGLPEFFGELRRWIEEDKRYRKYKISVEHYIVSTGLAEMIRGSRIAPYVNGIWGCEFIEEPELSALCGANEAQRAAGPAAGQRQITQVGYTIDNTSKTRAIFEINKGSNVDEKIDVNASMSPHDRRVPFAHMIYIADGPSDVPAFSIVRQNGGRTFAVYKRGAVKEFQQADRLRKDNRIDMYGEADYTELTQTTMWLREQTRQIAEAIYQEKEQAIVRSVSEPPWHVNE
ncbi:MAG TPA: haloacid dehalogenase-like hydrolase [Bacilli bacterium]